MDWKHSPAPWVWEYGSLRDKDGDEVLSYEVDEDIMEGKSLEILALREEDGELIAAAPELLKALQAFPDPNLFIDAPGYKRASIRWWENNAIPAINKALGKDS